MSKRASVHTIGCRLNQSESALIADRLRDAGYRVVPFGETADLGIINTCTVTREADAKSRQAVRAFIRKNPAAYTAVVGCYSQLGFKTLADIQGIDLIVGTQEKLNVLDYVTQKKNETPLIVRDRIERDDFSIPTTGKHSRIQRTNLKLQDGCDFMCSFCAIPFARGRARSRAFANLMEEARQLSEQGVREIVLTGVNLGMYRQEGRTLVDVLDALSELAGIARIRISSIEPTTIPEAVLERMAAPDHPLVPHLHIPVQSGSDRILGLMRRRYTRGEYQQFIEYAAIRVPDICIGTDLMVGFPGETDRDFQATAHLLAEGPIAYAHVFKYSERHNTLAARMSEKVDSRTQDRRSGMLRDLSRMKRRAFHDRFVGKTIEVLFETERNGFWVGHTGNYIRVMVRCSKQLTNQIKSVRLEHASGECVAGSFDCADYPEP